MWLLNPYGFGESDPFFANVSLLLAGNGTNGSTFIVDSSPSPKTVTAVGNTQISTAQSKFGGSSIAFDGLGDEITIAASSGFQFGTGDFTVEGWCYLLSAPTTGYPDLFRDGNSAGFINFRQSTTFAITTNSAVVATAPRGASINEWFHYAATRSGNTFRAFLNGESGTPATFTGAWGANGALFIGGGNVQQLNGHLAQVRVTKGIARYQSNFIPPTAPFPVK